MWRELAWDDKEGLAKYAEVGLKFFASDAHYEMKSEDYLSMQCKNKGENQHLFLYDDGKKQMIWGTKWSNSFPTPHSQEPGAWKIVDLAYLGEWGELDPDNVSHEALKFGVRSVREWLDVQKITYGYIIFNMDTQKLDVLVGEPLAQKVIFLKFLNLLQKYLWEITSTESFSDGTHFVCNFNRDAEKKPADEVNYII